MDDKTAEADSVSDSVGGSALEIEITEAMIAAGGEILERICDLMREFYCSGYVGTLLGSCGACCRAEMASEELPPPYHVMAPRGAVWATHYSDVILAFGGGSRASVRIKPPD